MVQHNDKWKKKATREYHKKHGTKPTPRDRNTAQTLPSEQPTTSEHDLPNDEQVVEGGEEQNDGEKTQEEIEAEEEERKERSKYARRKIESNFWRFESEEPDPYLVINEEDLEPPEPDYAHLPSRPFDLPKHGSAPVSGTGRVKKLVMKENELQPLKEQIDKANAARAFKERFSVGQKRGNVIRVGEDGRVVKEGKMGLEEDEEDDDELEDIDKFLAELDLKKAAGEKEKAVEGGNGQPVVRGKRGRADLESFVDSLI